ncbi:hypothetical protein KAT24_00210 [Candidatus Pacearchaeota archaeon]|nr:hypothetical protein [Candidatus Pacearchaeota archaeon]
MLKRYNNEFGRMYEELKNKRNPLEIINERIHLFESDGIGAIGIAYYLGAYIKEKATCLDDNV